MNPSHSQTHSLPTSRELEDGPNDAPGVVYLGMGCVYESTTTAGAPIRRLLILPSTLRLIPPPLTNHPIRLGSELARPVFHPGM